jgi:hypothetical protein
MRPDETAATVARRLRASPARVFDAFADAAIVGRWLTPSPEVSLTVLQYEFRVGGRYRFAYRVPGRRTITSTAIFGSSSRRSDSPSPGSAQFVIGRARGQTPVDILWMDKVQPAVVSQRFERPTRQLLAEAVQIVE